MSALAMRCTLRYDDAALKKFPGRIGMKLNDLLAEECWIDHGRRENLIWL
jgi:hypothetical protein